MNERDLPLDLVDFEESVLSDLHDDWVGVYEVWWEANGRYPDLPVSHRLAVAERVVSGLIQDGRARLAVGRYSEPWTKRPGEHPRVSFSCEPVPAHEASSRLRAWATWVPQGEEMVVLEVPDDSSA